MRLRLIAPSWGRMPAMVVALLCVLALPAAAQPKNRKADKGGPAAPAKEDGKAPAKKDGKAPKEKDFNFTDFNLAGKMRTPQLLYFLERANEELERASLEKRSFIPHLVRTVEEETL